MKDFVTRYIAAIDADAGKNGTFFRAWAIDHGWKLGQTDKRGRGWAWCAMRTSKAVHDATEGRVTLALGLRPNGADVFTGGNASVPSILRRARALGLTVAPSESRPGVIPIMEVRHKDEAGVLPPWKDKASHIGAGLAESIIKGGRIVGWKGREGNWGNKECAVSRLVPVGPSAKERYWVGVDIEKYVGMVLGVEPADEPEPTAPDLELAEDLLYEGKDFEGEVADGDGRTLVLRCVACDADGGYDAIEIDPATGQMVGDRVYRPSEWAPTGAAYSA